MEMLPLLDRFGDMVELVLLGVVIMLVREIRQIRERQNAHEDLCQDRQKQIHGKIDMLMREVAEINGKLEK